MSSLGGSSGRAFLATSGDTRVVARLDASDDVLRRVGEIGAGPEVLASGRLGDRPLVLQRYVAGGSLSPTAFAATWRNVAALIGRYQADPVLADLADPLAASGYAADLRDRAAAVDPTLAADTERLVAQAPSASITVATHGDPNLSNFVGGKSVLLVDWDDLRRADPMRDIGQIAWWYVPPQRWSDFLEAAGVVPTADAVARLFWWSAAESLDVALRLLPVAPAAASRFIADFRAALAGKANPRRVA